MKVQVGQRAKVPDLEFRSTMAFLSMCCTAQIPTTRRTYPGKCKRCEAPTKAALYENIETGQVWFEAPDNCPVCNYQLVPENPPRLELTQKEIEKLFGKF